MELLPILSALKRNKLGAVLMAVQIGVTLAVVANATAIIKDHLKDMARPSGLDEANIFTLENKWVGRPEDLRARIDADMAALRAIPGVVDAEATNSFALSGGGWVGLIRLKANQTNDAVRITQYLSTTHGRAAQGLEVVAGRWFTADEIGETTSTDRKAIPTAVITAALAQRLFPDGHVLGQSIYMAEKGPTRIIGIVARAQTPWPAAGRLAVASEFAAFLPLQFVNNGITYIVRTQPGQQARIMRAAPERLREITRLRDVEELHPFSETRTRTYAVDAATSWLLGSVCALLLMITALGTMGLTLYWVGQRRRQIGMRRALGARRVDILRYFHTENLIVAGSGALLGVVGGLAANLWMTTHLDTARISPVYMGSGALIVLLLCQLAVLWPALRAASVAPSLAMRGL